MARPFSLCSATCHANLAPRPLVRLRRGMALRLSAPVNLAACAPSTDPLPRLFRIEGVALGASVRW